MPYKDRWELLRRLWQLPSGPEMNLPDNLRTEEVPVAAARPADDRQAGALRSLSPAGPRRFPLRRQAVSAQDTARGIVDEEKAADPRPRPARGARAGRVAGRAARAADGRLAGRDATTSGSRLTAPERASTRSIDEGWIVEAQGYHVRRAGTWRMNVTSGVDWFDLAGTLDFDGMQVAAAGNPRSPPPRPELRAAERRLAGHPAAGMAGAVSPRWPNWARRRTAPSASAPRRPCCWTPCWPPRSKSPSTPLSRRLRENLRSFNGIGPVDEPRGFCGELRHYQKAGLGWLELPARTSASAAAWPTTWAWARRSRCWPCCKSAAAALPRATAAAPRPSLAVVPRSLVFNWIEEAKRFTPDLRVLDYTGLQRGPLGDRLRSIRPGDHHLRHDAARHRQAQGHPLRLRDPRRIAGHQERPLAAGQGQPAVEGRPPPGDDRHARGKPPGRALVAVGVPQSGHARHAPVFQDISKTVTEDNEGLALLRRALGPFILRRTKQQVLTELPPKTEQTLHCDLEGKQRKRYDELRTYYRAVLAERIAKKGMAQSKIHVLEALLRLRQAAIHPGLIDKDALDESSAKLDVLMEQLREMIDEGHKALVFSQFTSFLAIVRNRLDREKLVYEYLDGRTRQRQERVERFQNDPKCPLFLISLKAGGHGLNLTAADYVFILDPWWNPAVEAQAIDRAHRIGQDRHVFAYRLIARDTVEEKIVELQQTKRDLADAIISADGNILSRLTSDDLELLLS